MCMKLPPMAVDVFDIDLLMFVLLCVCRLLSLFRDFLFVIVYFCGSCEWKTETKLSRCSFAI